ncbi:hypothetical protein BCR32DRAFT_280935 [Anaeromyces robustus]|uniref:Wntless-like transmembrane domain-containing protein n=1 Tax=Anaeromyces robustus TaxID=1754192 RepID=A0A1Y1X2V9_9FUNG|nr:hypothetical protein BCR32DRAFT_280935 [Anaeromyces robustus]|eukprot:ORX79958.1 hypothetical protein BCR32DRAFT_280935 [Anaeromyces robustus]
MNISANNKYLKCISNRISAIIYLVYMLVVFLFFFCVSILKFERKYSSYLLVGLSGLGTLYVAISIYEIIKTGEVDTDIYYSTKKFIKYLVIFLVVLICFCVIAIIVSYKQSIIDDYKKSYETKHPNDPKLNDSEISKKYRYKKFILFSSVYLFITFTFCLRQITFNEYVKEYKDDNLENSRQLEQGN